MNVLSLGSYDVDWLEQHRVVLNYFDKTFTYLNNKGDIVTIKGIKRKTTIRKCNIPISWSNSVDRLILGPELLKEI